MPKDLNSLTKITVNNFPDSVRENPDVYISGAKPELASFSEIIANAVDEAKAGYCDTINVAIDKNDNVMVQDNGLSHPPEHGYCHSAGRQSGYLPHQSYSQLPSEKLSGRMGVQK